MKMIGVERFGDVMRARDMRDAFLATTGIVLHETVGLHHFGATTTNAL